MATKRSDLRDQIRAFLYDSPTSVGEDVEALSHCAAQRRNRGLGEHLARDGGLALAGFRIPDGRPGRHASAGIFCGGLTEGSSRSQ